MMPPPPVLGIALPTTSWNFSSVSVHANREALGAGLCEAADRAAEHPGAGWAWEPCTFTQQSEGWKGVLSPCCVLLHVRDYGFHGNSHQKPSEILLLKHLTVLKPTVSLNI